jgi:hypothetical protein
MDLVFVGAFLTVLFVIADEDWKTRKLSDASLMLLWGALCIPFYTESAWMATIGFAIAGLGFLLSYGCLYTCPIMVFKRPLLRSGDIILLPAVLAFGAVVAGFCGICVVGFVVGLSLIISYKKELPFALPMFLAAFACAVFSVVTS